MAKNGKLKAYVRYDGTGRIIPGSLILNRFKPAVGKWEETPAYECCNPVVLPALRLMFTDISFANGLVGDATNVNDWNTYLNLPALGTPFTSVNVSGNEVALYGGSNITIADNKFEAVPQKPNIPYLISVIDEGGAIVQLNNAVFQSQYDLYLLYLPLLTSAGYFCFNDCTLLTTIDLPLLSSAGDQCFQSCTSLTTVSLPLLQTAGDYCFLNCISLVTITLPLLQTVGINCFYACTSLVTVTLPELTTAGESCFDNCTSLTEILLPSCTNLGGTVGYDLVFSNIIGNTISLTIPASRMTCDAGNPDGDIVDLQANNTVTITTT